MLDLPAVGHIRQSLNNVLALGYGNNWHTWNFPNPPLQVLIVCGYEIDSVLLHTVDDAIVRIRALVITLEPFPALISCYTQRNAVFGAEFLQLGHDAGCDDGCGFGVEQVHEGLVEFEFAVYCVREEVGVNKDRVRRAKGSVGLEEKGRRDLGAGECQLYCLLPMMCVCGCEDLNMV
jgi:hypothetical protein